MLFSLYISDPKISLDPRIVKKSGVFMEKIPDNLKTELWSMFDEYRVVYLATSANNIPRVRPVTLVMLDSKFWILTGTNDAKIQQLRENPKVELCLPIEEGENTGYARFGGSIQIINDRETRKRIAENVDYFGNYWKTPDDPKYTLLAAEFEEVEYMEPGQNSSEKYRFS